MDPKGHESLTFCNVPLKSKFFVGWGWGGAAGAGCWLKLMWIKWQPHSYPTNMNAIPNAKYLSSCLLKQINVVPPRDPTQLGILTPKIRAPYSL